MWTIHTLYMNASVEARLRTQFARRYKVIGHESVSTLIKALIPNTKNLVILRMASQELEVVFESIQILHRTHPTIPIVGYIELAEQYMPYIVNAINLGLADFMIAGYDDRVEYLQGILDEVDVQMITESLRTSIDRIPNQTAQTFCRLCFTHALSPISVGELADRMHIRRQQINLALRASNLPMAEWFVRSARVLVALNLLLDPERSVASVSRAMNYSDDKVLRRSITKYIGRDFFRTRSVTVFEQWIDYLRTVLVGDALVTV